MVGREWALVTGASGGLGAEFAKNLAQRGTSLVLAARSRQEMERLAGDLRPDYGVEVVVEPLDLSEQGSASELVERLDDRGIAPAILVNNAGFGLSGSFIDHDPVRLRAMLQLDVVSLAELTHILGRRMAASGGGRILLVGSMAAYQPVPNLAAYAAAKAFVLSLGEALNIEFAPEVAVTVLSPGVMDTAFHAVSGFEPSAAMNRMALAPTKVAQIGLDTLFAGKSGVIAGRLNKVMGFSSRLMSRHLVAKLAANI